MPRYSVTLQVRTDPPAQPRDDQVAAATGLLAEEHGHLTPGPDGWDVVLTVESANPLAAGKRGHHLAMSIAQQAGLPAGEVVRIQSVRDDVPATTLD